ncbi:hypothetical protein BGW39_000566 [Mortierella sp. 14UC]|nr:hypothetical protein BGW39_000566 [Mortierella sp. 14UC]
MRRRYQTLRALWGIVVAEDNVNKEIEQRAKIVPVPDWFKAQHMTMVNSDLVESAIGKLFYTILKPALTDGCEFVRVTKPVSSSPVGSPAMAANTALTVLSNTSTAQEQDSFIVGLMRDIVRLIGNLVYRSRHVQDRIKNCNRRIIMLGQCNIDGATPYLRECAIMAMRNTLAGNAENQTLIEELQSIEAADHPALLESRIGLKLDAENGRPVLVATNLSLGPVQR